MPRSMSPRLCQATVPLLPTLMTADNTILVAIGFATSFVAGWFVVRSLLEYVTRHGFALFAWWRVIVGSLGLIGLALVG